VNTELVFRLIAIVFIIVLFGINGYFRGRAERQAGTLRSREGGRAVVWVRLYALVAMFPLLGYLLNPAWMSWARLPLPDWRAGSASDWQWWFCHSATGSSRA
jgi:hypothetical protein